MGVASLVLAAVRYGIRTKRGGRLLLLGALHSFRVARSRRARRAYLQAWRIAAHPARRAVRTTAVRVKR
jgi:hypothetical protein